MDRKQDWDYVLEELRARYPGPDRVPLSQRLVEVPVALISLILSAPLMLVIAVAIRRDSPGPALFRQYRVGRGGRLFRFTKFRTLYVDAKERFPELYSYRYTEEELPTFCIKVPDDPRVTRVGKWLRESTLDELPNFWHVLVGDMALVGPRPEIPELLPYYLRDALIKFSVRPGITGLAQVSGRARLTFRQTEAFDVAYVNSRSALGDVAILFKTLWKILSRDGAF